MARDDIMYATVIPGEATPVDSKRTAVSLANLLVTKEGESIAVVTRTVTREGAPDHFLRDLLYVVRRDDRGRALTSTDEAVIRANAARYDFGEALDAHASDPPLSARSTNPTPPHSKRSAHPARERARTRQRGRHDGGREDPTR